MIRDNYLDINKIVFDKKIFKLFYAVQSHGGVLRFVGGAVRDALAGIKNFDLDLATDLSPEELVEACEENALKTVPIGIKFGTVGVVINNKTLEVTSLRKDIKTDGRHAVVEFTSDWNTDASRRDLTINAIYADENGTVFDYYNGIDDLEKGIVRFIGNAGQRIKEDYLRILRFFRFYSIFGKTDIDSKALKACIENKDGLRSLSLERIRDELQKIIMTDNAAKTLKIMFDNDILSYFLPEIKNFQNLQFLINLVKKYNIPTNFYRRFFILYNPDVSLAQNLSSRLKFSKKNRDLFIDWATYSDVTLPDFENVNSLRKLLYLHGREFCFNKFLILVSLNLKESSHFQDILRQIDNLDIPIFPLKGKDIIDAGILNHHHISDVLQQLENFWIENNFSLSFNDLFAQAQNLVSQLNNQD